VKLAYLKIWLLDGIIASCLIDFGIPSKPATGEQ